MPPRTRKLKSVAEPARTMPNLRQSVDDAIAAMSWLTDSDRAMVDVARALADQIETAVETHEEYAALIRECAGDPGLLKRIQKFEAAANVQKTVGWLAPQLQGVLRDLGGAPKARKEMQVDSPTGSRLAQLRAGLGKPAQTPDA